jgi:ATP-binding cassette subfamily C (CFTR/MRP) protein 1
MVVVATHSDSMFWTPSLVAQVLSFVVSLLLCALSYSEHSKSLRPSVLLNGYLFVTLLFDAATLRTLWLHTTSAWTIRGLSSVTLLFKLIILLLEAREKRNYFSPEFEERSPEESSGLYNQGVYWWLNRLIWGGFRQVLQPEDLYPVSFDMSAHVLGPVFWTQWNSSKDQIYIS